MCGIAGIMTCPGAPPPDAATISALAAGIAHRGPDGEGMARAPGIVLLHNRLAIIDLATGDQPIHLGEASIVANGEIYNYRELQRAFAGERFSTQSDCEPPLHLWHHLASHHAARCRGMFAIALLDRASGALTLSRDGFGIKPLYLRQDARGIAFASEPSALLDAGLASRTLDSTRRDELLQHQFIAGSQTIFADITRVRPGETLRVEQGRIVSRVQQALSFDPPLARRSEEAALALLDRTLMESVDLHQRTDVPYGMFLSGGIDSATILALMARLNDRPVLAYTAGWDAPGAADERAAAASLARAVGARHETIEITEAMVWRHLPAIVACLDDPVADYAIIPTWFLARRAREDVKVILSGEGGDEMFAGYGRYRRALRPRLLGGRPMRGRGALARVGLLPDRPPPAAEAAPGHTKLQRAQSTDIATWLPDDLLVKLDRCLMAHAVEGRTPFVDPIVHRLAMSLPDELKVRGRIGKYLLRRWLADALPASAPWARKQGFTVPIAGWIAGQASRLGALVAAQPAIRAIAPPDAVSRVFAAASSGNAAGQAAWILLFYALWHRRHAIGISTEADVFTALAQTSDVRTSLR